MECLARRRGEAADAAGIEPRNTRKARKGAAVFARKSVAGVLREEGMIEWRHSSLVGFLT